MPDQKISQLASGTNAQTGDLFVIARSGANYSLTTAQLFNAPSATATLAALTVDTNTLFVDAANNRVGINTLTPSARLDINTGASASAIVMQAASDTAAQMQLGVGANGGSAPALVSTGNGLQIATTSASAITLFTNSVERMRLDSSGNLGIGTTSPAGKLHITGSTSSFVFNTTGTELYNTNSGAVKLYASNAAGFLSMGAGGRDNDLILSAAGNLGLSVTPAAWTSTARAIQFGVTGSLHSAVSGSDYVALDYNVVVLTGGTTYRQTDVASRYRQLSGQHQWFTAPSGTAGATITFTQAMTLDASGKLQIGATGPATFDRVIISGTDATANDLTLHGAATSQVRINFSRPSGLGQGEIGYNMSTDVMRFVTAAVDRWRINASGHFLASADATYDIGASGATRPRNLYLAGLIKLDSASDASIVSTRTGGASVKIEGGGSFGFVQVTTNHPLQIATNNTERVRVKAEGQVRFVPLAAAPTTSVEDGDVYYDSGTNKLRVRAGGAWVDLH